MDILSDVNVSGKVVANSLYTDEINADVGLDINVESDIDISARYINLYVGELHTCNSETFHFANSVAYLKSITTNYITATDCVYCPNADSYLKSICTNTITTTDINIFGCLIYDKYYNVNTIDIPADCTRFLIKEYPSICAESDYKYPIVSAYNNYKKVDIDVEISFADSTEKIIGEITASSEPMTLKVSVF